MDEYKSHKYRYFILSFAVSFLVLSILFLSLVNFVHPRVPSALSPGKRDITDAEPMWRPEEDDSLTILFMGKSGDNSPPGVYLLARFDPVRGSVPIVALPPETSIDNSGKIETLTDIYTYGGAGYTQNALERTLNIKIDRYIRMNTDAFIQCADAIGSVEFFLNAPVDILKSGAKVRFGEGNQLLDGAKAAQLITWDSKQSAADSRHKLTCELVAAIVNQRMDVILTTTSDRIFERIINLIDTDISYADYVNHKAAFSYMAQNTPNPAAAMPVLGSYNETKTAFTMSDTFLAQLARSFVAA